MRVRARVRVRETNFFFLRGLFLRRKNFAPLKGQCRCCVDGDVCVDGCFAIAFRSAWRRVPKPAWNRALCRLDGSRLVSSLARHPSRVGDGSLPRVATARAVPSAASAWADASKLCAAPRDGVPKPAANRARRRLDDSWLVSQLAERQVGSLRDFGQTRFQQLTSHGLCDTITRS